MRTLYVIALVSLLSFPVLADTTLPRDEKIEALAGDLHALKRITAVAKELRDNRQVILAIIEENIETLREKREDGSYRWASLQREEGGRVSDEKPVVKVETEKELQTITVAAPDAFRALIIAPRKRNLISANNRVFVRNLIVETTPAGASPVRYELPVNVWVNPGDTHGVALQEIANARVTAELGVESGNKAAVAQVALIQAKLVDDPTSPYFPAVKRLLQLREIASAEHPQRGALKTITDEAILGIPGELEARAAEQQAAIEARKHLLTSGENKGSIAPGDATTDVLHELTEIARLMAGTLDEQAQARQRLEALKVALTP
mgnify:CR=1 FL=1